TTANSTAAAARRFLRNNRQGRANFSPASGKLLLDAAVLQNRDSNRLAACSKWSKIMPASLSRQSSRSCRSQSERRKTEAAWSTSVGRRLPKAAPDFE